MKALFALLLGVCAFAAERPLMGNYRVWQLFKSGESTQTIIAAISGSNPRFDLRPTELSKLTNNGVPQEIIDAMTAHQLNPNDDFRAARLRSQKPAEPRPDHWGMTRGMPEVSIGLGDQTVQVLARAEVSRPLFPTRRLRSDSSRWMVLLALTGTPLSPEASTATETPFVSICLVSGSQRRTKLG